MTVNKMFDVFMNTVGFTPERWREYVSVISKDDPIGDVSDTFDIINKPWETWTEEEKIRFDKVWIYVYTNYVDKK